MLIVNKLRSGQFAFIELETTSNRFALLIVLLLFVPLYSVSRQALWVEPT
jgi:hypothetical protein